VLPLFDNRLLSFEEDVASAFSRVAAKAQAAGNRIDFASFAIAAFAVARGFMPATRNTKNIKGAGVSLLNPRHLAT
jgi:predicted nucleic acid-binding protein